MHYCESVNINNIWINFMIKNSMLTINIFDKNICIFAFRFVFSYDII